MDVTEPSVFPFSYLPIVHSTHDISERGNVKLKDGAGNADSGP